jgi:hypothetical protein
MNIINIEIFQYRKSIKISHLYGKYRKNTFRKYS